MGQHEYRRLRDAVGDHDGFRFATADRGGHDDVARVLALPKQVHRRRDREIDAVEIYVDHGLPILVGRFRRVYRPGYPRVGEQVVQATERLSDGLDHPLNRGLLGYVGDYRARVGVAGRVDIVGYLVCTRLVDVRHDDVDAVTAEPATDTSTDARPAAGDERNRRRLPGGRARPVGRYAVVSIDVG